MLQYKTKISINNSKLIGYSGLYRYDFNPQTERVPDLHVREVRVGQLHVGQVMGKV